MWWVLPLGRWERTKQLQVEVREWGECKAPTSRAEMSGIPVTEWS